MYRSWKSILPQTNARSVDAIQPSFGVKAHQCAVLGCLRHLLLLASADLNGLIIIVVYTRGNWKDIKGRIGLS